MKGYKGNITFEIGVNANSEKQAEAILIKKALAIQKLLETEMPITIVKTDL